MKMIFAENAPAAIGPYCHAVQAGNTFYISGQVPFHPKTGEVVGSTMTEQAKQTFANLKAVLDATGLTPANIAKTTCFLSDFSLFSEFNTAYAEFMGEHKPARICVEVARLPRDVFVEMDAIAITD